MSLIPQEDLIRVAQSIDNVFMIISTILVFKIQIGFAFMEGGVVRAKNTQTILFKCCTDICLNTIAWWMVGYGFAFGDDYKNFIGQSDFVLNSQDHPDWVFAQLMFHWALMNISTKIVSGCVAERMKLLGYSVFSLFQACWIFPLVVHWTWGTGFLQDAGYVDQAGSGVVHLVGGTCGLVCIIFIGPRLNRFSPSRKSEEFRPSNIPLNIFGSIIMWFSFYAYITGSSKSPVGEGQANSIQRIFINTTLSASAAATTSGLFYYAKNWLYKRNKKWQSQDGISLSQISIPNFCNGFLSGLVGVTASGGYIRPYAAITIGVFSAIAFQLIVMVMQRKKLDDPLDAVGVHLGGGIVGLVGVGLFHCQRGLAYHNVELLKVELLGIAVIIGWCAVMSSFALLLLKYVGLLVETDEVQEMGQDVHYFGSSPYNYDLSTMKVLKILEYTQTLTNFISEELPKEASIILKMDSEESYDPGEQVYIIE